MSATARGSVRSVRRPRLLAATAAVLALAASACTTPSQNFQKQTEEYLEESDAVSFASYLYELRHGANAEAEFSQLVDLLTTNETYFFRERSQLNALVHEIIPEIRASQSGRKRPVSIWSAGCSSGEEPFSIVMMGLEANLVPGVDFRVYASDISKAVLSKARRWI